MTFEIWYIKQLKYLLSEICNNMLVVVFFLFLISKKHHHHSDESTDDNQNITCIMVNGMPCQTYSNGFPSDQVIISDRGVEKVPVNIDGVKKAMSTIGDSIDKDVSLPAEGKTTRIIRII